MLRFLSWKVFSILRASTCFPLDTSVGKDNARTVASNRSPYQPVASRVSGEGRRVIVETEVSLIKKGHRVSEERKGSRLEGFMALNCTAFGESGKWERLGLPM